MLGTLADDRHHQGSMPLFEILKKRIALTVSSDSTGLTQLMQTYKISSKLLTFSIFQIVPYQARGFDLVYPVDGMRQLWSALRNRVAR